MEYRSEGGKKRREKENKSGLWDSHCPFFDGELIVNNKFYDKFYQWDFFYRQ